MSANRRWFFNFFAGFALVLAVLTWVLFAPVKLGGQNEYIIIRGNSMEPAIVTGDLIITRKAHVYSIGDAVAYRSPDLNNVVFHRIIAKNLDRYVFQGDNNDWTDGYTPVFSELAGKQWIHIPAAGKVIEWVREPLFYAIIVALFATLLFIIAFFKSRKTKRSTMDPISRFKEWMVKHFQPGSSSKTHALSQNSRIPSLGSNPDRPESRQSIKARQVNSLVEVSFFVFGLIALSSLVLGAFAFFNPLTRPAKQDYPYTQRGTFAYSAPAPAGVYDSQSVKSGDPVFTKLTCKVDMVFDYLIAGEELQNVSGTHQLIAVLSDPTSGWTRTFALEQQQPFSTNGFSSQVAVDFCGLQAIASEMELQTGVATHSYTLAIDPNVSVSGTIDSTTLTDNFKSSLVFQLDSVRAYIVRTGSEQDPLNPSVEGLASYEFIEPNAFAILNGQLPVTTARLLTLIGLGISLIGMIALISIIGSTSKRSKEMLVRMKHGSSMVDVESSLASFSRPAVDVLDIDDLARLAEKNNTVILHEARGWLHTYLVEADQVTYRYTLNEMPEIAAIEGNQTNRLSAANLQLGIKNGEFKVYYQPIVSILDKRIMAVEALLRWQHPQNGLLSANDFITQAENTGMIDILGEWVLQEASTQVKEWRAAGTPLRLAVNFSQSQIEKQPARLISQVLRRTGLSLDALQIEIAESSLLKNPEVIFSNLVELQKIGVHLSLDGYTGDSSLTSLKQVPFETIKINRSLVMKLDKPESAQFVQGIISAALDRGLNVVAEGVENQFQMNLLRSQYCSQAQGYLIARPAPANEISTLLTGM